MTPPDPQSEAQAEELLPCVGLGCNIVAHGNGCPAFYYPAVAQALSELRDELTEHKEACAFYEAERDRLAAENARLREALDTGTDDGLEDSHNPRAGRTEGR